MKGYIEQAFKGYTDWWRYLLGVLFIFFIWQLGSLIHFFSVFFKIYQKGFSYEYVMHKVLDINVMMTTLESNLNFFLLLLGFAFGFGAIILVVKIFHQLDMKNLITTRPKIDWKRVGLSFGIITVFISGSILLDYKLSPENYEYNFELNRFLILALIGIVMVPIQTTFEELYFRGYLMQGLGSVFKSRAVALILTSVLFGALHFGNPEIGKLGNELLITYIGTGFLLGIMTLMDDGLELAIGFHAGNNLLTALLVTSDWTVFQTYSVLRFTGEPSVISDIYIPIFVIYPILILIFARLYKWKNWKTKLFGKVEKELPAKV